MLHHSSVHVPGFRTRRWRRVVEGLVGLAFFSVLLHGCAPFFNRSGASSEYQAAIKLARDASELYRRGTCHDKELALQRYNDAATLLSAHGGEKAASQAARALQNCAAIYNELGRTDDAVTSLRRAVHMLRKDSGDTVGLVQPLNSLAEVYHGIGSLDSARTYYQQALTLSQSLDSSESDDVLLNNIGIAHGVAGRLDSALFYLERAKQIRERTHDTLGLSVTLYNIGYVLKTLGRADASIPILRESLALRRTTRDAAGEGRILNSIGYAYDLLEKPDSALTYYRRALDVHEMGCNISAEAVTLINIGRVQLDLNRPDSALAYVQRGFGIKKAAADLEGQSWALSELGRIHRFMGESDTALAYFSDALSMLRNVQDRTREGLTLYEIGRTYMDRRRTGLEGRRTDLERRRAGESRMDDLHMASAYFDSAAAVRASVRLHAGTDANTLSFAEQDVRLFNDWTFATLARGEEIGSSNAQLAALAVAESGRAQALLHLMQETVSDPSAGRDLVEEGRRLLEGSGGTSTASLIYLVTDDTLLAWMARPSSQVQLVRSAIPRDSLEALVQSLRYGVGADEAADRSAPLLERGVRPAGMDIPDTTAARLLVQILIPPSLLDRLPDSGELVIVPHGVLGLVPFAALPLPGTDDLLGTRFALRFAPSLASLMELKKTGTTDLRDRGSNVLANALIVGNPAASAVIDDGGKTIRLASLPGAEREARWLAEELHVERPIFGTGATEKEVKLRAPDAPLLHFATHGYAYSSDARARDTFIALAPGEDDDGLLTVGEILDDFPEISAELVVLSACQTGLGNMKQAEGTVGLQRAFLAKGARSALVSLWSISDSATELLMRRFYTHWLHDAGRPSKAEALQRAQADVRQTAGFEHPRYWAAMQLVGAE